MARLGTGRLRTLLKNNTTDITLNSSSFAFRREHVRLGNENITLNKSSSGQLVLLGNKAVPAEDTVAIITLPDASARGADGVTYTMVCCNNFMSTSAHYAIVTPNSNSHFVGLLHYASGGVEGVADSGNRGDYTNSGSFRIHVSGTVKGDTIQLTAVRGTPDGDSWWHVTNSSISGAYADAGTDSGTQVTWQFA